MLHALMDGRALTASELARVAGIAPQTASGHLTRMTAAGLLSVEKQGRHRYHRLASPGIARMMESIMQVASDLERPRKRLTVGPREAALRRARTCYDHLAGKLGVALTDALVVASYAELTNEAGLVTDSGIDFLVRMGVDLDASLAPRTEKSRRVLCRPCLDWSERRRHLAGAVGAAICAHSFADGWIRRMDGTRAVMITPKGLQVFREQFGAKIE
jgi:DNA-binding transcriptional ArsR family regulator